MPGVVASDVRPPHPDGPFQVKPPLTLADNIDMPSRLAVFGLSAVLALVAACGSNTPQGQSPREPAPPGSPATRASTLVIGTISEDPTEDAAVYQPFADVLARHLADEGVTRGRVRVAGSMADMAALLRQGAVDLYFDSPFAAVTVIRASGARPLLRRWKDGVAEYRSVVFTRADRQIREIPDLAGAHVAFEDDFSTSGYFLPAATLIRGGLRLREATDPNLPSSPHTATYGFTGDDENTLYWVFAGRADAGAMSEESLEELAGSRMGQLRVVARSIAVPRHVVVATPRLSESRTADIRAALMGMHRSVKGRKAMMAFEETARFDVLASADLADVRGLVAELGPDLSTG